MSSQSQPESTARRRKTLRYSVVFSPEASTESLRMDYEPKEILEDTDDVAPSAHSRLWTILNTIVLQILSVGILLPLALGWKIVTRCLHTLGFQIRGAPFLLHCLSFFFFRPLGFILPLLENALKIVTCGYISFDGPTFRHLVGMTLNGFGFAWHAVLDTLATPPSQWAGALERFQTFLEDNGLDLEMKLALGPRFLDNLAVYDDVQGMLGLGADRRVQDTKLDSTQLAKLEQQSSSPQKQQQHTVHERGSSFYAFCYGRLWRRRHFWDIVGNRRSGRNRSSQSLGGPERWR
ncbi:expressed unknown protein [Seminavis robusta]|uniref:Uncharacterized protein n=1 Tax=Seminavis robusta TaxID=568900 RepID=A0A9N8HRW0_9STRA|nr:expressed unknown protein [Seminavis robusta]|eukprot:Sro1629_g287130.1 n/a (292) ;mRNA; f:19096-19971